MIKKAVVCFLAVLFVLSVAGVVLADEISGTISNVASGGEVITVKDGDGNEVELIVNSERTAINGVGSPNDLAVGQKVKVTYEGEEAKSISVSK